MPKESQINEYSDNVERSETSDVRRLRAVYKSHSST